MLNKLIYIYLAYKMYNNLWICNTIYSCIQFGRRFYSRCFPKVSPPPSPRISPQMNQLVNTTTVQNSNHSSPLSPEFEEFCLIENIDI